MIFIKANRIIALVNLLLSSPLVINFIYILFIGDLEGMPMEFVAIVAADLVVMVVAITSLFQKESGLRLLNVLFLIFEVVKVALAIFFVYLLKDMRLF